MKSRNKSILLKKISIHLSKFDSELRSTFICPTCLKRFDIANKETISVAHITPDSAGGTQKTFLCKKCNSDFGSRQDRWLGDHLKIIKENKTAIEGNRAKSFWIDGIRFGGKIVVNRENGVDVCINLNSSAPDSWNELLRIKQDGGPTTLKVPVPIISKTNYIDVGYLTAAYLAWFEAFGYSWVLQSHLDIVRKQILNPAQKIIEAKYIYNQASNFSFVDGAILLVVHKAGVYMPAVAIAKSIVILPTPITSLISFYEHNEGRQGEITEWKTVKVKEEIGWDKPTSISYDDKQFIWPDCLLKTPEIGHHYLYPDLDSKAIKLSMTKIK